MRGEEEVDKEMGEEGRASLGDLGNAAHRPRKPRIVDELHNAVGDFVGERVRSNFVGTHGSCGLVERLASCAKSFNNSKCVPQRGR